jgi:ATP-dependent HslUV protease, peptidase subunit HslV
VARRELRVGYLSARSRGKEWIVSVITIVKKNGVVAIAADTLSTAGSRKLSATHNQQPSKIARIGSSFVGLTGWSVHQQVLEHLFGTVSDPPALSSTAQIFDVFLKLHPRLKEEYFLNPRGGDGDAYESSQMTVLIANQHGIFGLYSARTVLEYARFWASGSGSDYALGAMHATYRSALDAVAIAEAGVRAAVEFDDGCGAPIESHSVRLVANHPHEPEPLERVEPGSEPVELLELVEPIGTAR